MWGARGGIRRAIAGVATLACGGCTSLLGIDSGNLVTVDGGDDAATSAIADGAAFGDSGRSEPGADGAQEPPPDAGREGGDGGPPVDGTSSSESGVVAESGVTVSGTVVDADLQPLAGWTVRVAGTSATTDANGAFTLSDVAAPYTAIVLAGAGSAPTTKHAYAFVGLQRTNPTLQLWFDVAPGLETSTLQGTTAIGATSNTAGIVFADVTPPARGAASNWTSVTGAGGGTFDTPVTWVGSNPSQATLYNLEWFLAPDGGPPNTFIAYTSGVATLTGGQSTTWQPMASVVLTDGTLSVTASIAPGYLLSATSLYLRPQGASIAPPVATMTAPPATVTLPTPNISGATFVVCGVQTLIVSTDAGAQTPYGAACHAGLAATDQAQLALPVAPVLVNPPSTASVHTTFAWTSISGGVAVAAFEPAVASNPSFFVVTDSNATTIPDTSQYGIALPAGAVYGASVYALSPFANIDDATGAEGYASVAVAQGLTQGPSATGQVAFSGVSRFTAQQ